MTPDPFWNLVCHSHTRDEIQALRDWAAEMERLEDEKRELRKAALADALGEALPTAAPSLLRRIGWYTRP